MTGNEDGDGARGAACGCLHGRHLPYGRVEGGEQRLGHGRVAQALAVQHHRHHRFVRVPAVGGADLFLHARALGRRERNARRAIGQRKKRRVLS